MVAVTVRSCGPVSTAHMPQTAIKAQMRGDRPARWRRWVVTLLGGSMLAGGVVAASMAVAQAAQEPAAQANDARRGDQQAGRPEQAASSIEEIVVTATKRGAQRIQEVPMSIQAVTADQIAATGALEFSDLAGLVPSLQVQDLGPGDKEYIIRGVNSSAVATVGVYYDEAVITARNKQDGGGRQADIELHDLARVEVLKGPQGTLYGASSMSGTIRFIPNAPDPSGFDFNASGTISGTRFGGANYHLDAMANMPIIEDKLALRAVGWFTDESGYIDNVRLNRKNSNTNNVYGGRFALRAIPTPRLDLTVSAVIQHRKVGDTSRFMPRYDPTYLANLNAFAGALAGAGFPVAAPPVGDLKSQDFTINEWNEDLQLYGVKGAYDTGVGSLFATVNYYKRRIDFRFDSTPILLFFGAPAPAVTFEPQEREVTSGELRFASDFDGPFNIVIGGFVAAENKNFEVRVMATGPTGLPLGPWDPTKDFFLDGPPNSAIFGRFKKDDLNQQALFGEATLDVTDDLHVTVGGRLFHYRLTSIGAQTKPFVGFVDTPRAVNVKTSTTNFQFKGNVSYDVTEDVLAYFTAAEGFRVGGTNDAAINPTGIDIPVSFRPDNLWNYELGWKSTLLDGRLVFNAAGYIIVWNDMQVPGVDPSGAFPIIVNAGKARIDGFEFEIHARPVAGLDVMLGGSVQNARLRQDQPLADPANPAFDPNAGLKGDKIPNVPDFQAAAAVTYRKPLTAGLDGLVHFDWSYRGNVNTQFRPTSPFNVPLAHYSLVNLRIGIENANWELSLYARNLFDKRAQVDAISSFQDPLAFITVRPRTLGARLTYRR